MVPAPGRNLLPARVLGWARRVWPGWPRTPARLGATALVVSLLGFGLGLTFAVGAETRQPDIDVERADERLPAPGSPSLVSVELDLPQSPRPPRTSRAEIARRLAFESFAQGEPLDGVTYFQLAVRARRRAPGDDVLIRQTIAALPDRRAGPAAAALLRQLGADARPLLREAASSHSSRAVRARAAGLLRGEATRGNRGSRQSRPFLRWLH